MKRKNEAMTGLRKIFILPLILASTAMLVVPQKHVLQYGFSSPFVVVEGTSMLPTLYNGDIVLIYKPPPDKIKIGDIVVYESLRGNLVIHRVIKINYGPGCNPVCFVTKGDNNYQADNVLGLEPKQGISYDRILGVVFSIHAKINGKEYAAPLRIPYLGLITIYIRG
jgi:signal peptidase